MTPTMFYRMSDAKVVFRALERLRNKAVEPACHAARRAFWTALGDAAEELALAVDTRVRMLSWASDTRGARAIEEAERRFYDPFQEPTSDPRFIPTPRNLLHLHWRLLGAAQTPDWREPVKRLRLGRTSLRQALKAHPSVRHALRYGLLFSGMAGQFGRRWLHRLEESPDTLREVGGLALDAKGLREQDGRSALPELAGFVAKVIDAAEACSGNKVTASDHKDRRSRTEGITRRTGPGVLFVHACVHPLYPAATLESCAGLIRQARLLRKRGTAHR